VSSVCKTALDVNLISHRMSFTEMSLLKCGYRVQNQHLLHFLNIVYCHNSAASETFYMNPLCSGGVK